MMLTLLAWVTPVLPSPAQLTPRTRPNRLLTSIVMRGWPRSRAKQLALDLIRAAERELAHTPRSEVFCENGQMHTIAVRLRGLPLPGRWALIGAASLGVIGAVVGLVVGLIVYAPTAPFAVFEIGLPAAIAGGVIGTGAGVIVIASRRVKQSRR